MAVEKAIAEGKNPDEIEKVGMSSNEILKLFYNEEKLTKFKKIGVTGFLQLSVTLRSKCKLNKILVILS